MPGKKKNASSTTLFHSKKSIEKKIKIKRKIIEATRKKWSNGKAQSPTLLIPVKTIKVTISQRSCLDWNLCLILK